LHAFAFSTGGKAEAGAILAETLSFTSALDHNEIVPFHFFVDGVLSEAFASATFEYWVTGMSFSSINTLLSGDNDFLYGMVIPAGQSQTIKVYTVLGARVQPSINMYSDYSHTAKIRLDLPTGITFTSASGTFLTAVPEPACLGLVAAVALGMTRRRRR
ncbi:MAG TPA: PEP-CTERM sorting domain-containing protein, partial [Tepidisphaeraceae bacterium]